jgi:circadian clock protein KaiB
MSQRAVFKFRLYVAGNAKNSGQAIANLTALCRAHLPDRHEIEIVDVFRQPKRALAEGILMTPTLVKLAPSPVRRIVGSLSQTQTILQALGLESLTISTRHSGRQPAAHAGRHRSPPTTYAT